MAFFNDSTTPITVYCDSCSEDLVPKNDEGVQDHPWKWVPLWGGIVSILPDEWEKWGITENEGKGLCHQCGKPC